jgi:hypothetical protein
MINLKTFFTKQIDTPENISQFAFAKPFPHIVLDNLIEPNVLHDLAQCFPSVEEKKWWHYDNALEVKFAFNDISKLDLSFQTFFGEANSFDMVAQLSRLTGLQNLVPDHTLNGGGLHQIKPGGKLDVHEDYNIHIPMAAYRKLNMITYVNENWKEEYGGHLELWDEGMTKCEMEVLPVFNRTVIFRTDMKSNHGHPKPLTCPEGMTRRSLATYFYVPMTDEQWASHKYTSTQFKKRPGDLTDVDVEELRIKRNKGRVADKIS